jgi:uncharacterized membrane protein YcaP (DUF421 family)
MHGLLGDPPDLSWAQMALRAVLVFVIALVYLRFANKRFMGRYTAFDAVLAIIFGSVMSRGVNGQAPFWPTMLSGAVLLALHWIIGAIALRSLRFSRFVKGSPRLLIENGKMNTAEMRRAHISEEDLIEDLRYEAHIDSVEGVQAAHLECNGKISVILEKKAERS